MTALFLLVGSLVPLVAAAYLGFFGVLLLIPKSNPPEGITLLASYGPVLIALAVTVALFAIAHVMAAFGLLAQRHWGWMLGIIVGAVGFLLTVGTVLGTEGPSTLFWRDLLWLGLILAAGYACTVTVLWRWRA